MDWIKLKLAEVVGSNQPVSKKLLVLMVSLVAAGIFLINTITDPKEAAVSVSVESEDAEVVIKPAEIFVHVVGEVISPGIYQLKSGARLMDAVFAAGGLSKSADQSSVNLARELSDGEQVMVFRIGESPVLSGGNSQNSRISLNQSNALELEQLPGVGPALAGRIVDWREANGGFKKKEDLLNISGIGDKLFAGIKDEVIL
jgi:competence protein ComEA